MKSIFITLMTFSLVFQASAQTYTSDDNKVSVEVEEFTQMEEGSDLQVTYRLTNSSDLDLARVDFKVVLMDIEKVALGTIDVYDFHISKRSKIKYNFNKSSTDFKHKKVDSFRLIPESLIVAYKKGIKSQMLSNPSMAISGRQ